ncbi:MAG: MFS transporter [Candidatus Zixiibacteriota bacterium]
MGGIILPVYVLYFRLFEITLFQVALLAAVFEATIIIFEIPTGRLADRYGRKLSTFIGFGLYALSALIFILFRNFIGFLVAEIIFGIAETFISGALEALAVDSLPESERDKRLAGLFANRTVYKTASLLCGMVLGGLIAGAMLPILFIPILVVAIFCLLLTLWLVEKGGDKAGEKPAGGSLSVITETIFSNRMVLALFMVGLAANFVYEPVDQFWQVLFSEIRKLEASFFGMITAAGMILVIVSARLTKRLYEYPGFCLSGAFMFVAAALLIAVWLPLAPAITGIIIYFALKELIRPIISTHLNRRIQSENRATMLSAYNMVCSIGEVAASVLAGLIAQKFGVSFLFYISSAGAVIIPVIYIVVSGGRKSKSQNRDTAIIR